MDKPKLHTPDFTEANIAKTAELFPSCVVEAKDDKTGELRRSIDFDQLRQELSDHIVEGPQERYRLDWPGKREALLAANAPIAKTLRPVREESVDFDTTQNLFLEGDNLDGLKLLQETYLGKVKVVIIDPPYNTGKSFIYDDDFAEEANEYFHRSLQVSDDGSRLVSNSEANGRFHSDWLSMIYARLRIARNLLSDQGVIFITIDDSEAANLKRICDEVFGERAFLSCICWKKRSSPDARSTIGSIHDNILCYVKNADNPKVAISKMPLTHERRSSFSNPDNDPRGPWASVDMTGMIGRATKEQFFEVNLPSGRIIKPPPGRSWGLAQKTFDSLKSDNRIWFGKDGDNVPRIKNFLSESEGQVVPSFWDMKEVGSNDDASKEMTELFDLTPRIFDTPKPVSLIKRMLEIGTTSDESNLVLDFFAGSSTTAHAVMQQNAEDGGNRRFIMVQLPEECDEKSEAFKAGYKTIAEISKERIRRVGAEIKDEIRRMKEETEGELLDDNTPRKSKTSSFSLHPSTFKNPEGFDTGFRVLKVDTSNVKDIYYAPDQIKQDELGLQVDHIKEDRTAEDLLFQVMLDWGVDLSLPVTPETIRGKQVYFVDENAIAACFETGIDEDFVKELAKRQPLRAVFRDTGYADDAVKINIGEIFKLLSPGTELKTI